MHKFLYVWRYSRTGSGEDVGIGETEFLAHYAEQCLVDSLIFQMEHKGRSLATAQILDIMLATHAKSVLEYLALQSSGIVNLLHHTRIYLLPESRHRRHTRRMRLSHRLLHLLRIGVYNHPCTHRHTQQSPSLLKDMGKGQEIEHTVVFTHRHHLLITLKGGIILLMTEHHPLTIASSTTSI